MKTPKQNSIKKAKEKLSFSSKGSESREFDKLMDDFGVSPIQKIERKRQSKPEKISSPSPPLEFQIDADCPLKSSAISVQNKFSGKQKPQKKNKIHKKRSIGRNFQPDAIIDLHGNTREEAIIRTGQFLKRSILQKYKTILVITGKGTDLENPNGILRKTIWDWLEKQKKEENFSFKWAPPFLGGKGAILVFL
ncbi:Smr/MutS family protein [bacterium]|nr:Smr/MutS family protein [bacterium]